jgi:hypothetical protein
MITTAFLYLILSFVNWAVSQLPAISTNDSIVTSLTTASGYISGIAQVFPVGTLMACVGFVLAFDAGWIIYQVIRWVYQKIPGIN